MSNENHQLFTTEQIRQRLEEEANLPAGWLRLLSHTTGQQHRPLACLPSLRSWTKRRRECFSNCC